MARRVHMALRMFASRLTLGFLGALTLSACTVKSADDSGKTAPPAGVAELFSEDLPDATPDALAGVWAAAKEETSSGTAELRFRFEEGRIIVGSHCVLSHDGKTYDIIAGQSAGLATEDLSAKEGSFELQEEVNFSGQDGPARCTGRLSAGKWNFAIDGKDAALTQTGKTGQHTIIKVAD